MSSPYRNNWIAGRGIAAGIFLVFAFAFSGAVVADELDNPAGESGPSTVPDTTLFPGGGSMPAQDPRAKSFDGNADAIAQGARLFDWYNCSGCHFHGAGGIGPSLMDKDWIYGSRIDQIYESTARGRPNGMPSWQSKIPPQQIWQIAAYIRSLSAPSPAQGGPAETQPVPPPAPVAPNPPAAATGTTVQPGEAAPPPPAPGKTP